MLSQHGFLWFWICSLIRSQLVCVVSISISCISDLILTCSRIQKKGISATFQIFSKKKKVPKNQHFFTHHPYFLDINTTHSTWLDCSRLMSDFSGRSREFIKACFRLETHLFLPLYVLGNRSKTLLLLIICKRTDSPTASRLRSEGTSLKSHRLNINSSRDRICTFFRFRMDMDHYVLSSLASLLFPEP